MSLSDHDLSSIFADVPSTTLPRQRLQQGIALVDALCETRLCPSRGEAKKLVKSGGAYVNNVRVAAPGHTLTPDALASQTILVLRTGKKKYPLLKFNCPPHSPTTLYHHRVDR